MNAHDRFESLAGAVALGEASPQERAEFDAHASGCTACRDDAADGAFVVARVADAHRGETWRPSQPIVERIRARRSGRTRLTLGALGWAVGASLVLNVALAGGLGSRLAGAFASQPAPPALVASSSLSLDAPHAHIFARRVPHQARSIVAVAPTKKRVPHADLAVAIAVRAVPKSKEPKLPTLDDVPDLLAGLDLYGTGSAHHRVAVETLPRCTSRGSDDRADAVVPCRATSGRVIR